MRYFLTRSGDTTLLYEADDELTKYRTIRTRPNNGKVSDKAEKEEDDMPTVWVHIMNAEYFQDITVEIPEEEVFLAIL